MNTVDIYWVIASFSGILALLALREAVILFRLPSFHPDRGLYWFNICFLTIAAGGVLYGGYYVDMGRRMIESLIAIPPSSRYAIERNKIIHDTTWVYVSDQHEEAIRSFYREYARARRITFLEDDHDAVRMSFTLPSGDLFLTLRTEGGKTILYFSRAGEVRTIVPPLVVSVQRQ